MIAHVVWTLPASGGLVILAYTQLRASVHCTKEILIEHKIHQHLLQKYEFIGQIRV